MDLERNDLSLNERKDMVRTVHKDYKPYYATYRVLHGTGDVIRDAIIREMYISEYGVDSVKIFKTGLFGNKTEYVRVTNMPFYTKVSELPINISEGSTMATLANCGNVEGFGDAVGINFEKGYANGHENDRDFFESKGMEFCHAFEDYGSPE